MSLESWMSTFEKTLALEDFAGGKLSELPNLAPSSVWKTTYRNQ